MKSIDFESNLVNIPTYQAGVAQASAYRAIGKLTETIIKDHNLTTMQWYMIGAIYDAGAGGLTTTRLSKVLDTNVSYITNTVNTLIAKNMVIRTTLDIDSRSKVLTIHPDFEPIIPTIEADLRTKLKKVIYQDVTPSDLLTYIKVLYKINQSIS